MRRRITCVLALGLTLAFGCGGEAEPEEEEETAGAETVPQEPVSTEMTEADAVSIALAAAEAEGYDVGAYSDIVVHVNDDDDFEVQLRKPRINRHLMVTVDHDTRAASLELRTHQAH